MDKHDAAETLRFYATLLELTEDTPFRARAYAGAARSLETLDEPWEELARSGRIAEIRGIGKGLAAALKQFAETQALPELDELRMQVPDGVLDLLRLPGLGTKKARALWQQLHIASLGQLEFACRVNRLIDLPGFGFKTQQKFLEGIAFLRATEGRHLRHHALAAAAALEKNLSNLSGVEKVIFAGSLRRGNETVGDLDVIIQASADKHVELQKQISKLLHIETSDKDDILRGRTTEGFEVELSLHDVASLPIALLFATGSKAHLTELTRIAKKRGLALTNENLKGRISSEGDVYRSLGMAPIPPELREGRGEIARASEAPFPEAITSKDLRGILHVHTTASDGRSTLRELASAAQENGFQYLGIADHSQSAAYAGGLTPERVRQQWKEIDELNKDIAPFRILKGTEVDIRTDGSLDYDDELLAGFDFVIASIHSGFRMTEEAATERLCRALENPHVDILGHPTGRLLLARDGYPVNMEAVIKCAAQHGKAIEMNSSPYRLDLDWRYLQTAQDAGVPIPLCPDAHDVNGLSDIHIGVQVARKGPLLTEGCLSTWTVDRVLEWTASHDK
ncbi:DNA polymerase/3'-5' exonuclease PolX [bacterium]|nr:DNA polymerase/3'-5' exonuclease PolX [bacterium]